MPTELLASQGTIKFPKGTKIPIGQTEHILIEDANLSYFDWRGACAGIYMLHPYLKRTVNYGPNLSLAPERDQDDINEAANGIVLSLAREYERLAALQQTGQLPEGADRDLKSLGKIVA